MHHKFHDNMGEDLRDQLESLSHEVASLKKQMARRGRRLHHGTRHMGEETAEWMRDYAIPELRRSAYRMQRSARENPGTAASVAAASVVVLGLAMALMMRR